MNILPWIIIIVVILIAAYLISQNKKTINANNTIAAIVPTCIPFTQAQQDIQKRDMISKCTNKLLVPFVGPVQYAACLKNVNDSLTPVNNC